MNEQPLNAPLETHKLGTVKEFIYSVIIIAVAIGAGNLIVSRGTQTIAQLQTIQNQANALQSQN